MSANAVTRWWWVRHAPVVDQDGIIYGQRDVACDTSDEKSFRALAETLPADAVWVTSHLSRAIDTAAAITAQGLKTPKPIVEKDLAEQCLGAWEGKTWDGFDMKTDHEYRKFWDDPARNAPPEGESFVDVFNRVAPVINRLTAAHGGSDIVAVAHGGTIRAAVALAMNLPPERALTVKTSTLALTIFDFFAAEGEHVSHGVRAGRNGTWRTVGINMPPSPANH